MNLQTKANVTSRDDIFNKDSYIQSPDETLMEGWLREILRSSQNRVITVTVEITPELAELLINDNPSNRPVSKNKVDEYCRSIINNRWDHNGETIKVAKTGELNDGQHRLLAVIKAGQSIVSEVVFGLNRDTRTTVDIGAKRSPGQHAAMRDIPNGNQAAHAAKYIINYYNHGNIIISTHQNPSTPEILDWLIENDVQDSIIAAGRIYRQFKFSYGVFSSLHYIFSQLSRHDVDKFYESLQSGLNLNNKDAIYKLREALIKNSGSKRKLPDEEIAALIIKTWNAYRKNRQVGALHWRSRGDNPEEFPLAR